jgi:hypothetical protein
MTRPAAERPIPMSGGNPAAILAGRKTQTRRHIRPQPKIAIWQDPYMMSPKNGRARFRPVAPDWPDGDDDDVYCPYGQPSDRLWVKEEHFLWGHWEIDTGADDSWNFIIQRERGALFTPPEGLLANYPRRRAVLGWYQRAPMFMPRWAARQLLEITEVRVERIQSISEADAIAEGIERKADGNGFYDPGEDFPKGFVLPRQGDETYRQWQDRTGAHWKTAKEAYRSLWHAINGAKNWSDNPWVWAVTFTPVTRTPSA